MAFYFINHLADGTVRYTLVLPVMGRVLLYAVPTSKRAAQFPTAPRPLGLTSNMYDVHHFAGRPQYTCLPRSYKNHDIAILEYVYVHTCTYSRTIILIN